MKDYIEKSPNNTNSSNGSSQEDNIENKYSDKNLTNTEAQTNQKTLNTKEINFDFEDNLNEKVSEEIISKLKNMIDTAPKLELTV